MNNNNNNNKNKKHANEIKELFLGLNREFVKYGFSTKELEDACLSPNNYTNKLLVLFLVIAVGLGVLLEYGVFQAAINYLLGIRCIVPNNYFVWEATRPVSDCNFCRTISKPIYFQNVTREEFVPYYAYSSKPIVVKKAFLHWPAMKYFSFNFFKELYANIEDSYRSVDEECQFLHFKSNFISIQDVFKMSEARIKNYPNEKSWYVGW